MSATTDTHAPRPWAMPWRPAGAIYLAAMLAGLAVGCWPGAIYPTDRPGGLPALQTVAVAQVLYVLLVWPIVLMRRWRGRMRPRYWAAVVVESAGLLAAAAPVYIVAGYLAGASASDALRAAIYLAALMPLAWAEGAWLASSDTWRPWAMMDLLTASLGLPAAYYIGLEFIGPDAAWLADLAPAVRIWTAAATNAAADSSFNLAALIPHPLWSLLLWPAVAAGLAMLFLLRARKSRSPRIRLRLAATARHVTQTAQK